MDLDKVVLAGNIYQAGYYQLPIKDVCPSNGIGTKLMIIVTTAPSHVAKREAVRFTWGQVALRPDIGLAFLIGTSVNQTENLLIKEENMMYGDIIQVNIFKLLQKILKFSFFIT